MDNERGTCGNPMKTIHEAASALRQGRLTPVDLVDQCLAQIDRWEAKVKAWVFVDREGAREEAKRLTEELRRGQRRSPLHGIPIGIKDIFDVFDWPTAAGSKLWSQSIARQDADVVRRLREAGAIFLGKTVTTAYASFDPPVTRNPWDAQRTPGGSSSGSAAALVTGMCLGAIGSQTGGSITRPASYCGVAGFKPSYGLVSCAGVVPLAPSMDHPGPMARCVKDLGLLLQVIAGVSFFGDGVPNYQFCLEGEIPPPRLGRLRGLFDDLADPAVLKMMDEVQAALAKKLPEPIAEIALPAAFGEVIANHRVIMAVEAAEFHRTRIQRHPEDYPPKIRSLIEEGMACPAPEYRRCLEHQQRLKEEMFDWFENVDALLTPATTGPAPAADTTGNPAFNSPWSYTGLPTVSFPTGHFAEGLPLALQLVGDHGCELQVLTAGLWCEQALDAKPLEAGLRE
jgi:Asp-tRNA(Asn)/Glu-tRNA(Gln) amidotransferase A subunit family amidase